MLEILNLTQGSDEWLAVRASHYCASEAPVMMGDSLHTKRNELLQQKTTGIKPVVTTAQQVRFDGGHAAEALARPLAEAVLMEDLTPMTGRLLVDGLPLLASLDGIIESRKIIWENKVNNKALVEAVLAGDMEPHYYWQLEQQLLVFGADKVYFTTSNGDPANTHGTWYQSVPERRAKLIAGWKQFALDLAACVPEVTEAPVIGKTMDDLPALIVHVTGMVTSSNLAQFEEIALGAIASVNRNLHTDQDFADSAKARKWCAGIEASCKQVNESILGQTGTINDALRVIAAVKKAAGDARLELEKKEKERSINIKRDMIAKGASDLDEHIRQCNTRIGQLLMPRVQADFAEAIKGKSKFANMQNDVDTLLSQKKIEANAIADKIKANLRHLSNIDAPMFLFSDLQTLATQDAEYFVSVVDARIDKHAKDEADKLEVQREAIRKEELVKIQQEADLAVQQACAAPVTEVIDADGVITQVAANRTVTELVERIAQSTPVVNSLANSFATFRPRASTRSLVDNVLNGLSEPELQRVLTFLQTSFTKRAA